MPRKPPQEYTLHREQDGAHIGGPYDLATARSEKARCSAEARVVVRHHPAIAAPDGSTVQPAYTEYGSMHMGEVCRYEIRSTDGLVIA